MNRILEKCNGYKINIKLFKLFNGDLRVANINVTDLKDRRAQEDLRIQRSSEGEERIC